MYAAIARRLLAAGLAVVAIKAALLATNQALNRRRPHARALMNASILGKSAFVRAKGSPIARAIAGSRDFRRFVEARIAAEAEALEAGPVAVRGSLVFRSNRDLQLALNKARVEGRLVLEGDTVVFTGRVLDSYDFQKIRKGDKASEEAWVIVFANNRAAELQAVRLLSRFPVKIGVEGRFAAPPPRPGRER